MATITSSEVKNIASLPKSEARSTLATVLKWPDFDEDKDMQKSIQIDFLYDMITFTTEKGFTWDKAACIVNFTNKLTTKFKGCGGITDILNFYNSQASYLLEILGEREFKLFSAHLFETILPHFKLYQYVFNAPRTEQIPNVKVHVEPPFDNMKLKETKTIKVWEYEQQIQELEKKEKESLSEKVNEKETRLSKLKEEQQSQVEKISPPTEGSFDKEALGNIIQEVMSTFTLTATETMKFDIERMRDDLEFKLEKTSLPRPQALGPPPRYNALNVKTPSAKNPKSPKPGSRMSNKSKRK